jgi:hypothetical protein
LPNSFVLWEVTSSTLSVVQHMVLQFVRTVSTLLHCHCLFHLAVQRACHYIQTTFVFLPLHYCSFCLVFLLIIFLSAFLYLVILFDILPQTKYSFVVFLLFRLLFHLLHLFLSWFCYIFFHIFQFF